MSELAYPESLCRELFPHGKTFRFGHMVLICGMPGNRSDFVTGWLANSDVPHLPFMPWFIEPAWGKSIILPFINARLIDVDPGARDFEQRRLDFKHLFNAHFQHRTPILVTKSHESSRSWAEFLLPELLDRVTIVDVIVGDGHRKEVHWQHFLKNCIYWINRWRLYPDAGYLDDYLYKNMLNHYKGTITLVNDLLQDTLALESHFRSDPPCPTPYNTSTDRKDIDLIRLDYGDLWHGRGPVELIEKFGLDQQHMDRWNFFAPQAVGPSRVWCMDRWWEPW